MKRLSLEEWSNILKNLKNMTTEEFYDGVIDWVEVMWLESSDEWCLCFGEELFEDGFKTAKEAHERLAYIEIETERR